MSQSGAHMGGQLLRSVGKNRSLRRAFTRSITHRRAILPDTARQVLRRTGARGGQIKASREWGTGAALRRMYRLGDVLPVRVQERKVKQGS
jgi:hypothetical protein